MNEPIPTPYDISEIASSPFSPSALAWTILFVFGLLSLLIIMARTRRTERLELKLRQHTQSTLAQIRASLSDQSMEYGLCAAASALKRFLSSKSHATFETLSGEELMQLALSPQYRDKRELIEVIAEIDAQKFSPACVRSQVESLLIRAENALQKEALS